MNGKCRNSPALPPMLWDGDRPGIYNILLQYASGKIPYPYQLPDEEECRKRANADAQFFDDDFDATRSRSTVARNAARLYAALDRYLRSPNPKNARALYRAIVRKTITADEFCSLHKRVLGNPLPRPEAAADLAEYLATRSPDRDAVTFAIALMAASPRNRHKRALETLMGHSRFTWMALWVRTRGMNSRDESLCVWEAVKRHVLRKPDYKGARLLQGTPKNIHLLTRLYPTDIQEIGRWLLAGAYKSHMPPYLSYGCAGGGRLMDVLRWKRVADDLLLGIGEILIAMTVDFESVTKEDMAHPAVSRAVSLWERHLDETNGSALEVVTLWLGHVEAGRRSDLRFIEQLDSIRYFCARNKKEWEFPPPPCWTPRARRETGRRVSAILSQPCWRDAVLSAMRHFRDYLTTVSAAQVLGMDVWEYRYQGQLRGYEADAYIGLLYNLTRRDASKKRRVLELMERQVDMAAFALGPDDEETIRQNSYWTHRVNCACVRALTRYPGIHPEIVAAAMRSPDRRYNLPARNTMRAWGPALWTDEMLQALRHTLAREEKPFFKKYLRLLLRMWKKDNRAFY